MPPLRFVLYAISLAAGVLAARAALVEPPPLWIAIAAAALYVGFVLFGVFVLSARMFVDATVHGRPGARGVALTFDDGPDPKWTPRVLDTLERAGAVATFFVIGRKVEDNPELAREILRRGHAIALHSYAHDRLFSLRGERRVREDFERGIRALLDVTGERPTLYRPPIGHTNPILARVIDDLDLHVIGWSVSGIDGLARSDPRKVVRRIRRGLRDGAIVLMHDAPERGDHDPAGVAALPGVLSAIEEKQLTVVPLAELL